MAGELADLLNNKFAGNVTRLAEEISKHVRADGAIDARHLRQIIDGKSKSLKISELDAFEKYLASQGHPLGLFERASILESLVESGGVNFFVATRPKDRRSYMSTWDVRAFGTIADRMNP